MPIRREAAVDGRRVDYAELFGHLSVPLAWGPPDWLANPRTGAVADSDLAWWRIGDFDDAVGDIKLFWELSRFDFTIPFMKRAVGGDAESLDRLNLWLRDWCDRNPPYLGLNWKCGQECSIRVLQLCAAMLVSGRPATRSLLWLLKTNVERIKPTVSYAISQNNNHGTSEASALFVGGLALDDSAVASLGRKLLENRVAVLIAEDGTFSQYSTNYHRLMLDTIAFAELFRRTTTEPRFSENLYDRVSRSVRWLNDLTDNRSGEAPNLGANDGARVLAYRPSDHNDMRPTLQLAGLLFSSPL